MSKCRFHKDVLDWSVMLGQISFKTLATLPPGRTKNHVSMVTISDTCWPVAPNDKKRGKRYCGLWFANGVMQWVTRRQRAFRDGSNVLEIYSSEDIVSGFCLFRESLTDDEATAAQLCHGSALFRFYASGSFLYCYILLWTFPVKCPCNC